MKRNVISTILVIYAIALIGCANVDENENNTASLSVSEESTYEPIETEQGTEIQNDEDAEEVVKDAFFSNKIDDKPQIIYEDEEVISLLNNRFYYSKPAAHGIDFQYGLNFDKRTNEVQYLYQYIPSLQSLIQAIEDDKYTVVYGEFRILDKEEIVEIFKKKLNEEDWCKYYSNFYVDEEHIYVIIDGTASDYSSLKLPRECFEFTNESRTSDIVEAKENGKELSSWEIYTPNFYDTVKLIYNNVEEICISFTRPYYIEETNEQQNLCYGLTINKKDGNYTIVYGATEMQSDKSEEKDVLLEVE